MRITLMHQTNEVLEFDIEFNLDFAPIALSQPRPLAAPELAPPGLLNNDAEAKRRLRAFLASRAIAANRPDLPQILKATGHASPLELAIRAGGFSLSDQFWYRTPQSPLTWEGSNFYRNAWDMSFGEAVLARDYDALSRADIIVPDVSCGGMQLKAWMLREGRPHLLKASSDGSGADLVGEELAFRMTNLLLGPADAVPHALVNINGTAYSSSPLFIREGEDLLPALQLCRIKTRKATDKSDDMPTWSDYARLMRDAGVTGCEQSIPKAAVATSLCFHNDTHPGNVCIIRTCGEKTLRLAPIFDFGGAFGTFTKDVSRYAQANQTFALLYVAWRFGSLDPTWDYSWFNPSKLEGFGEVVEQTLASCEALPPTYPAFVRAVFEQQLEYVTSVASQL